MNRKKVFQLMSSYGELSKAEISRISGISAPTVIKIINYFLETGFVTYVGEGESELGRKPQLYRFNPEASFSVGVEFEGDFLKLGIVDLSGGLKACRQIRVDPDFDHILGNRLSIYINDLLEEYGIHKNKVLGVGIGIPGAVDPEKNVINFAPLIGIKSPKDCRGLLEALKHQLGFEIIIENDVNAAAKGEFVARGLGPEADLVYISLGTGLGAGIIVDGRLRRGRNYSAGEFGYMVYDNGYETSKSRPGWLESQINFQALSEKWDFLKIPEAQGSDIPRYSEHVGELAGYVASHLALGIANINAIIDMELVVVGGITPKLLGIPLVAEVNRHLKRLCVNEIDCQLQKCAEPGIVGMASMVAEARMDELLAD